MTSPSSLQSPRGDDDMPTISTTQLRAIRAAITPNRGWWQFELRPWHYWTAIASTAITAAAFIALIATLGAVR